MTAILNFCSSLACALIEHMPTNRMQRATNGRYMTSPISLQEWADAAGRMFQFDHSLMRVPRNVSCTGLTARCWCHSSTHGGVREPLPNGECIRPQRIQFIPVVGTAVN